MNKNINFKILLTILFSSIFLLLLIEGFYSLSKKSENHISITYNVYSNIRDNDTNLESNFRHKGVVYDQIELENLIGDVKSLNGFIGNSPYSDKFEQTLTSDESGCFRYKNNLDMKSYFIRTNLYNVYDPVTIWIDNGKIIPSDLIHFLDSKSYGYSKFTTNDRGLRATNFNIDPNKNLNIFGGGGAALSSMISDAYTIPYLIKEHDQDSQYINASVSSRNFSDVMCNFKKELNFYKDFKIQNLILLMSDLDLSQLENSDILIYLEEIDNIKSKYGIEEVIIIYFPYIYTVSPEITSNRNSNYPNVYFKDAIKKKDFLISNISKFGFQSIDGLNVFLYEIQKENSLLNVFEYYLHHGQPSYKANALIVNQIIKLVKK
tara:strand:+ start:367 stop:1497 length:1131 start_codon:yes stop_codon:yes gene_type:complete